MYVCMYVCMYVYNHKYSCVANTDELPRSQVGISMKLLWFQWNFAFILRKSASTMEEGNHMTRGKDKDRRVNKEKGGEPQNTYHLIRNPIREFKLHVRIIRNPTISRFRGASRSTKLSPPPTSDL